jgi:Family of unknown function (DUF6308)
MSEILTIGGLKVETSKAEKWMARYVQTNSGRWSYPAYDSYPGTPSRQLGEQDLLATSLLNAHQKPITSYYTLRKLLPELNRRLETLDSADSLIGRMGKQFVLWRNSSGYWTPWKHRKWG